MHEGEDFIFISAGNPKEVIRKFLDENNFSFEQEIWEYPWSPQDNEEIKEFENFDSILEYVLSQKSPEYIFYPSGKTSCWFGISKDQSVVFGITYSGQDLMELVNLAKSYDGKFGYISVDVFPDLGGIESYSQGEKHPDSIGYKDDLFTFYGDRELFSKHAKQPNIAWWQKILKRG